VREKISRFQLMPLMLAHFLNDTYSNFLPAFLPLLQGKFTLSLTLVSLLASLYTVGGSLLQVLFGYLGDRWTRLNFAALGPLFTGLFMSSIGLLPAYPWVILALLMAAGGTAMFHPQAAAHAGRSAGSRKGLSLSFFIAAGSLGFALGPLLMALFITDFGFSQTYWAIMPLILLGGGLYLMMQRGVGDHDLAQRSLQPLRAHLRPLLLLWALVVTRHTIVLSFTTFLVILLVQKGIGYVMGSLALSGFLIAEALGGMLAGHLSDRLGRRLVTVISLGLAFPLGFGAASTSGPLFFILLLLTGMMLQASNPVILAQAQEIAPANPSVASAIVMGFGWGTAGLLLIAVGSLSDHWGIVVALQIVCASAFVIFLGQAYAFYREERFNPKRSSLTTEASAMH
jgi:FSR family fosmidomycin resistance protein-like MFS transporter